MPAIETASNTDLETAVRAQHVDHENVQSLRAIVRQTRARRRAERGVRGWLKGAVLSTEVRYPAESLKPGQEMAAFVIQDGRFRAARLVTRVMEGACEFPSMAVVASVARLGEEIAYDGMVATMLDPAERLRLGMVAAEPLALLRAQATPLQPDQ